MRELIQVNVYNPRKAIFGKKNDRAYATYFYCGLDTCAMFDENLCANQAFFNSCPYGQIEKVVGPTPRAKSFNKFIDEHEATPNNLQHPGQEHCFMVVGDNYWVQAPHLNMDKNNNYMPNPKPRFFVSDETWLPIECLTREWLCAVVEHKPYSLMGDVIRTYRKQSLPILLRGLKDRLPEWYNGLLAVKPSIVHMIVPESFESEVRMMPGNHDKCRWQGYEGLLWHYKEGKKYVFSYVTELPPTGQRVECKVELDPQDMVDVLDWKDILTVRDKYKRENTES